jgi:hypothetical protein
VAKEKSNTKAQSESSKKVASAARAGQGSAASVGKEKRDLGFPLALAAVIILGVALVVFARSNRDTSSLSPTFGDHWHSAYGIYDCTVDGFQPHLDDPQTANSGIHTHGDGVMHIHPRGSDATGSNAQLIRFLEATRTEINDDMEMTFPDRPTLTEEGVTCDGQDVVLQIVRFSPDSDIAAEIVTEDLNDFRLREDGERIVIALAPLGADIPLPPQEALDTAAAASPDVLDTTGLNTLDLGDTGSIAGFDDDGNLVDEDGNIVIPAADIAETTDEDAGDEADG